MKNLPVLSFERPLKKAAVMNYVRFLAGDRFNIKVTKEVTKNVVLLNDADMGEDIIRIEYYARNFTVMSVLSSKISQQKNKHKIKTTEDSILFLNSFKKYIKQVYDSHLKTEHEVALIKARVSRQKPNLSMYYDFNLIGINTLEIKPNFETHRYTTENPIFKISVAPADVGNFKYMFSKLASGPDRKYYISKVETFNDQQRVINFLVNTLTKYFRSASNVRITVLERINNRPAGVEAERERLRDRLNRIIISYPRHD